MFFRKIPNGYLVRLEKGEEIIESLSSLAEREKIPGGFLYGLGAVKDVTLGYFDVANKKYVKKDFDVPQALEVLQRGICWASESKTGPHEKWISPVYPAG